MPSARWLARLTIPIMAGAALVTSAAIATADPINDGYLNQLRAFGFTWPEGHEEAITGMAYLICDISGGAGRQTRLPSKSTPTWTRMALRTDRSDPW
jgi:hypothetical protein